MGYFTEGYRHGRKLQSGECALEEHEKVLKEVLKSGVYNDCVEWYNGFYKAMLDSDIQRLEQAFVTLKEKAEKGKK